MPVMSSSISVVLVSFLSLSVVHSLSVSLVHCAKQLLQLCSLLFNQLAFASLLLPQLLLRRRLTGAALAAARKLYSIYMYGQRQYDARDTVIYVISSSIVLLFVMPHSHCRHHTYSRSVIIRNAAADHACAGSAAIWDRACHFVDKPNILLLVASTNWLDRILQ